MHNKKLMNNLFRLVASDNVFARHPCRSQRTPMWENFSQLACTAPTLVPVMYFMSGVNPRGTIYCNGHLIIQPIQTLRDGQTGHMYIFKLCWDLISKLLRYTKLDRLNLILQGDSHKSVHILILRKNKNTLNCLVQT